MSSPADSPEGDVRRGWWRDLGELVATFPAGARVRLTLYVVLQVFISFLDLVGLAVVVPIMQVLSGARLDHGVLAVLYGCFGRPDRAEFTLMLCLIMIAAFAAKAVFALAVNRWSLTFVAQLQVGTATKLLRSYLREDYLVLRRRDIGPVIRTLGSSVQAAHAGVLGGILGLFSHVLSICFILIFLGAVDPTTTLIVVTYFCCAIIAVQRVLGQRSRRAGSVAHRAAGDMSHAMHEAVYAAREIRMHDAEDQFVLEYERTSRTNGLASRDANFYSQAPKYLLEFITIVGIALLLVSAAMRMDPSTFLPTITVFVAAAVKLLPTLTALTATLGTIRFSQEGLHATVLALQHLREQQAAKEVAEASAVSGAPRSADVEVRNLTFTYPDATRAVLRDVSFDLVEGRSMAICGVSGSGKTTLVDVILGLLRPTSGQVLFGGRDLREIRSEWVRAVAYVPQDVHLLAGTLRQNVTFDLGREGSDDVHVLECLRRAQLEELLDRLPEGLDTQLGPRGVQLSGGQRQRVGIARALYRRPSVLVLDEATSALDNQTEAEFAAVLRGLSGHVSIVLVAHRFMTVRNVDEVLFLEDGAVAGRGDFQSLQQSNSSFARLVSLGKVEK